jgi:hypothetical protein
VVVLDVAALVADDEAELVVVELLHGAACTMMKASSSVPKVIALMLRDVGHDVHLRRRDAEGGRALLDDAVDARKLRVAPTFTAGGPEESAP